MAKVGAQRAAELTGKSKSTIQRSMNNGKLSYELDSNNRRLIDVSELERVFGLEPQGNTKSMEATQHSIEAELKKAADMLEMERMKMKVKALEDQLDTAETTIEDLKGQRDQWQKQAQQVLITSQYSQKQAEELKAELKEREEKARKRREEMLQERMKRLQGQNQNQKQQEEQASSAFDFGGLWKKLKGDKAA
ncbi:MAG: entry exclusion 1 domain-containing protein [Alphaproteobacteria bacterium]|nr:entry exclusion 1 domain-containing protein [Alphaproteobacteria bacterium]NCQ88775.1 entry exclusion 1 domain-containing protein [Alphaproteobacteria bacterium]NCT07302.1 entry exclusion 1 domain-containing protein [Alphaproteobacteria bacterium]